MLCDRCGYCDSDFSAYSGPERAKYFANPYFTFFVQCPRCAAIVKDPRSHRALDCRFVAERVKGFVGEGNLSE